MKEQISLAKQELIKEKEAPSIFEGFQNRLKGAKEYINRLPDNLKRTALLTVLFSLGVYSVTEAGNTSGFDKTIADLKGGKNTIENATDSIYNNFSKDTTYSYVEAKQHELGQNRNIEVQVSGPSISVRDTISMGNVEAVEYGVMVTEENNNDGQTEFKQECRFLSGVKPYTGAVEEINNEKNSYISYGKTEQQAIVSAISGLSGLVKSKVSSVLEKFDKDENKNGEYSHTSNVLGIITIESDNILKNVRVVITKTSEGFTAEAFCG